MLIVHAADIHLDSPLVGLKARAEDRADEFVQATRQALAQLIKFGFLENTGLRLSAIYLNDRPLNGMPTGK